MKPDRTILLFLPHLDVVGGLGVHCRMLLSALNTIPSPFRFTVVSPRDPSSLFANVHLEPFDRLSVDGLRFSFHNITIPDGFNLAGELDSVLKPLVDQVKPDLVYCSYYTGMRDPTVPQLVTFHDAGFLDNPTGFGTVAATRRRTLNDIRVSISCIHCISNDARDRICRLLPWDQSKTAMVWHALPETQETLENAKKWDASDVSIGHRNVMEMVPYFFVPVGAATGFNRVRKNVPTAIRAFRLLPAGPTRMIVAGTAMLTEQVLNELLPAAEKGRVIAGCWWADDGRVVIVPAMERTAFLAAMSRAVAVVYPSRYEGFGFPLLEAMALGVPLIASQSTSVPEIVADAALLADPDDVTGFASAMQSLLADKTLGPTFVERGRQRMELFTLNRLGQEMVALFKRIIHESP